MWCPLLGQTGTAGFKAVNETFIDWIILDDVPVLEREGASIRLSAETVKHSVRLWNHMSAAIGLNRLEDDQHKRVLF